MCGLTGFLDSTIALNSEDLHALVERMAVTMTLRGPDDCGAWVDAQAGIALGFRRLSIVDLSPAGHQPMVSSSGRYVIAFNGEVYNSQPLRAELEAAKQAPSFRGHSDTEVMLACFEAWGVEAAVKRFIGMFAIALWDRKERALHLVRDRLGVKPLYYALFGKTLLFGSELKPLRGHPAFRGEIDRNALALFLRHNYIPGPYCIYQNVFKLLPGTIVTIPAGANTLPEPKPYWSAKDVAERGTDDPFNGSEREAVEFLDTLLREATGLRMIADVPLGVFLSGGIDSSVVVAQMQAQSARPVKTYTIGFYEEGYNEAVHAKAVAQHLGTEHTELYVSPEEAMAVIPKLPALYDEPFADSSQIPTYLVSELARRSVTVSLSGDGGDELFGGYNRYFQGRAIWNRLQHIPRSFRSMSASALMLLSPHAWDSVYRTVSPLLPRSMKQRQPGEKLTKLAEVLAVDSPDAMYRELVSHWKEPMAIVRESCEPPTVLTDLKRRACLDDFTLRMMYLDTVSYLPDDILTKVDRASMGVSLEAREPLLDHRIVEFAWRVPMKMKIRDGQGKWLLRQVLAKYVPPDLMERPKMGFGIPLHEWLRGDLKEWAESLLDEKRLQKEGFFNPGPIREKWESHLSGKMNWHYYLWDVLMFQQWLESSAI
jgi:asparagine synthase (glutamine-hydrolysing)